MYCGLRSQPGCSASPGWRERNCCQCSSAPGLGGLSCAKEGDAAAIRKSVRQTTTIFFILPPPDSFARFLRLNFTTSSRVAKRPPSIGSGSERAFVLQSLEREGGRWRDILFVVPAGVTPAH